MKRYVDRQGDVIQDDGSHKCVEAAWDESGWMVFFNETLMDEKICGRARRCDTR
jgi:hypothetical protein